MRVREEGEEEVGRARKEVENRERKGKALHTTCKLYKSRSEQAETKIGKAFETYSKLSSVEAGAGAA